MDRTAAPETTRVSWDVGVAPRSGTERSLGQVCPDRAGVPGHPRAGELGTRGGATPAPWLASATSSIVVVESQGVRVAFWQRG